MRRAFSQLACAVIALSVCSPVLAQAPHAATAPTANINHGFKARRQPNHTSSAPRDPHALAAALAHAAASVADLLRWTTATPGAMQQFFTRTGLAALQRAGRWRGACKMAEARLRLSLAEIELDNRAPDAAARAADQYDRVASLLETSQGEDAVADRALLLAGARLGLARLATDDRTRIVLARRGLEALGQPPYRDVRRGWIAASLHMVLGDALADEQSDPAAGLEQYRRALPLLYHVGRVYLPARRDLGRWHMQIARRHWEADRPEKADEHASIAADVYGQYRCPGPLDHLQMAALEHLRGQIAWHWRGDPLTAADHMRDALRLYRDNRRAVSEVARDHGCSHQSQDDEAACLRDLSEILLALEQADDAFALLDRAVTLLEQRRDAPLQLALCLLARGTARAEVADDFEGAAEDYQRAIATLDSAQDGADMPPVRLWSAVRLAEAMLALGQPPGDGVAILSRESAVAPPAAPPSPVQLLARAHAAHLLANLQAGAPAGFRFEEPKGQPVFRALRQGFQRAIDAYHTALKQGEGSRADLGRCYLDYATALSPRAEQSDLARRNFRLAVEHLAEAAVEEPDALLDLAAAHALLAEHLLAAAGRERVALGNLDSAVGAARKAVRHGLPDARVHLAELLAQRGHWELERPVEDLGSEEAAAGPRERAMRWLEEAAVTFRLARELDDAQGTALSEAACRRTLARLDWERGCAPEQIAARLADARERLDAVEVHDGPWHVEAARLDQLEAEHIAAHAQHPAAAAETFRSAVRHYEQALDSGMPAVEEMEVAVFNLADFCAAYLGDAAEALAWFRKDLGLLDRLPLPDAHRDACRSLVLMRMGLVHSRLLLRPDRARERYAEAVARLEEARSSHVADTELVVRVLVGLGVLAAELPDLEANAADHFRSAAETTAASAQKSDRLAALEYTARHGLAMQHERKGRYTAAAEQMRRCVTLAGRLDFESLSQDREYFEHLVRLASARPDEKH